jgi:hypothetical protein
MIGVVASGLIALEGDGLIADDPAARSVAAEETRWASRFDLARVTKKLPA